MRGGSPAWASTAAFTRRARSARPIAIILSGDRTERLSEIAVPTVVIHGEDDPLIGDSGGRATAAAIPGAKLVLIPGMGHDLPAGVWEQVAGEVARNAGSAS